MTKKKSNFAGKVSSDARSGSTYGYLNLPKGVNLFKEKDVNKSVLLDILPYEVTDAHHINRNDEKEIAIPGTLWYKKPFKIHRNIGATNETVVCLSTFGKKCPICEARSKMIKDDAEKEDVDALKPSLRNLYVVLPIGLKDYDEVPYIWDISHYLFQKQLNEELDEKEKYEIFPDLEEGYSLNIRFSEESLGKNKFYEANRIDFEDRGQQYSEDILDDVPNLDKVLKVLSYTQLDNLFLEIDEEENTEQAHEHEEVDEPRERKSLRGGKNKEEKPSRSSRKPDRDKDEEKEEKPSRSRSRKKDEDENECPEGFVFGKDCETDDKCEECDLWNQCYDAKITLENE